MSKYVCGRRVDAASEPSSARGARRSLVSQRRQSSLGRRMVHMRRSRHERTRHESVRLRLRQGFAFSFVVFGWPDAWKFLSTRSLATSLSWQPSLSLSLRIFSMTQPCHQMCFPTWQSDHSTHLELVSRLREKPKSWVCVYLNLCAKWSDVAIFATITHL